MTGRPDYLERGEKARLFPILSDTSKEGRTTSIVLACLAHVQEFGRAMLATVGQRLGVRAEIVCYTEICFKKGETPTSDRPDGLIVLKVGSREWKALVEAKVGNAELEQSQVERYLELARLERFSTVMNWMGIPISVWFLIHAFCRVQEAGMDGTTSFDGFAFAASDRRD